MLAPADLTEPLGELSGDLFPVLPGDVYATPAAKLAALLALWIAAGVAASLGTPAAGSDAALAHYVYARAKRSVYARLLSAPAQAAVDGEGSRTYSPAQISAWATQAAAHEAAFAVLAVPLPALGFDLIRTRR